MFCDPQNAIAWTLRNRIYKALKGKSKGGSTEKLIGCTIEFFEKHIENQFEQGMSWFNHGQGEGKWHIDHRRPCAAFDLENEDEQMMCFHYTNQQPKWSRENLSKGKNMSECGNWRWTGERWKNEEED
ncbi:MAG: hypothetical protein H2066_04105 [Candidatus Poseidoniales archaeon]|nr:hypothetical protein [Candidatus Poseidoniales archaeon]